MRLIMRILFIFCFVFIVYAHVWERIQILRMGYLVSEREQKQEKLVKEQRVLWLKLCRLMSAEKAKSFSRKELNMVEPGKTRIIEVVSKTD